MAQYRQRVDETVYAQSAQLVPGLRGRARRMLHYPDPLTEPPIGPIKETNNGFPWTYLPQRTKSFAPAQVVLKVNKNGHFIKEYTFKAQPIQELGVRQCQ